MRERLERYWCFDLPGLDFYRIEQHLGQCADCTRAYQVIQQRLDAQAAAERDISADATLANVTGWRYLDASGEQFQSNYLTDDEQDQLADEILATLDGYDTELAGETESVAVAVNEPSERFGRHLKPRRGPWKGPKRVRHLLIMAASLLLMFALPVLALVAVREFLSTPTPSESSAESNKERSTMNMQLPPMPHLGSDGPSVEKAVPNVDALNEAIVVTDMLDAVTEAKLRDFELAALLPNTEEEYEAWARKEYPHVMGLYDILTEVDENDPNAVPLWDGVPVNIPAWGMRLYEDTPSDERPEGWRALLIYSGEIFKFDHPQSIEEPNCIPTVEGCKRAIAIAGCVLANMEPPFVVENLDILGRSNLVREAEPPVSSPPVLVKVVKSSDMGGISENSALACDMLTYFANCGRTLQSPRFDNVTHEAEVLLFELMNPKVSECNVRVWRNRFERLVDNRWKLFEGLTQ